MKRRNLFVYLFIFIVFVTKSVYSQTSISGTINEYTLIDSIYPTKDTIEVKNSSSYFADDTVMVYQVKGADARTDTSMTVRHLFGTLTASDANNSGKYEIILVEKVVGNKIILKVSLNNDYDIEGIVQLIRVPSYENVSVNGELTCKNWEGTTGGVLVLMVSDTLFLNADINVTGKGFRGAEPFLSDGTCAITDTILYKSYYFNENADTVSAGYKGEGVSEFDPVYRKGLGRWANGGGGGNGRFTGGGGGGNAGNGGIGGAEDTTVCGGVAWSYDNWKGLGGNDGYGFKGIPGTINDSTIYLGGGGGSGTYMNGFTATNGGNGGGIVIIIAKNIKTSDRQIIANGDSVSVVATSSAGGGGAGGIVVFDVDSIIGDLSIYCNGGNGGYVQSDGEAGPGGGGGGGVVFWRKTKPDNITEAKFKGGNPGYIDELYPGTPWSYHASGGADGTNEINIKTPLTGFLYNSIISNQDVCWGFAPKLLEGSSLRGGDGPGSYTYQWQDSPNGADWTDISGATQEDYQAPFLTDTIYYRRVAYSGTITDYGTDVKVVVHDTLQNNNILGDDLIICIGNVGDTITGTTVVLGGDYENYNYIWQFRTDSENWSNFTSPDVDDTTFLPGIISDTSYVRRIVISGACRDTVAPSIEIIGLPQIANNIISADPEICCNDIPSLVIGNNPENGDSAYTYQWQKRTNSSSWDDIPGANLKDYQHPALNDTTYYKRIVYSDDCFDESEPDTIIVLDSISNNIIGSDVSTCYNTQNQIDGSIPIGGRNIYEYQWWESSDASSWTEVLTDAMDQNYLSYKLTNKTYFRRFVKSGACENTSDNIEVTIDPLPVAVLEEFTDTTCSGTDINLKFTVTEGQQSYILTYNDGENDSIVQGFVEDLNTVTINPTTTQGSKDFNYTIVAVEDQNECFATDITGLGELTVYGNPTSDAGVDRENCSLQYQLEATPSLGLGIWETVSGQGTVDFANATLAGTIVTVDEAGKYIYKWKETNWECVDSANVQITFYEKLENVDAGSDTTLYFIDEYTLNGSYFDPDEEVDVITTWNKISDNDGEIIYPNALITDIIDLFDADNTGVIISWTVEKGVCEDKADTVTLKLEEIFTPTGFTPNGDGINDNLKFLGLENSASNELIIYNRWGTEVYRMSNLTNESGWDGKNNSGNELPEDTYYYILTVTSKKNSTENHKGFFVIKRF